MSKPLNAYQQAAAKVYGGGDFAHFADITSTQALDGIELRECGDTLFKFVMIELSTGEDCDSLDTAKQRIATAISELEDVARALEGIDE